MSGATVGRLIGVGVGPGDPGLVTVAAIEALRAADVIATPRSSDYGSSVAWSIVRPHVTLRPEQRRLALTFPMVMDSVQVVEYWERAFTALDPLLRAGKTVAFIAEGDPLLYSTFGYLLVEAGRRWPRVEVEVVPGVTSVTAVASVAGVPLSDGQERIAIVPARYGIDDLDRLLDAFDTVVLMKLGDEIERIVRVLESKGVVDRAVFVRGATMARQEVVRDVRTLAGQRGGCFAMMIVAQKRRAGVLLGRSPRAPAPWPARKREAL